MSAKRKNELSEIMRLAWQFVKKNGYSMSEALKTAWQNIRLNPTLTPKIIFKKFQGSFPLYLFPN